MKFAVVLLAVVALASPMSAWKVPRSGTGALADDLQVFVDALPLNKMINIAVEYLSSDTQFQELISFLKSTDFQQLVLEIEAIPEAIELVNYIQQAGVDVYYLLNKLHSFIGLPPIKKPIVGTLKITGGIRGFLDDIEALVPVKKIKELYKQKMATSKVFADLFTKLRSPITQTIADKLFANPHFVAILDRAKSVGIDVNAVKDFLSRFLGLKLPHFY